MSLRTITLSTPAAADAADAAFEQSLAEISKANPALFSGKTARLPQDHLRELARTFFYLGFQAGETTTQS